MAWTNSNNFLKMPTTLTLTLHSHMKLQLQYIFGMCYKKLKTTPLTLPYTVSLQADTAICIIKTMLLSTPLNQRAASRVQHPNHVAANSLPPGGKERLHFVRIRPEVQARKGGW